jgi:periplasmic divalent cation tolerance protein
MGSIIMKHYIQVSTTTEKKEDAERIARTLVRKKLAAFVQIIGEISSTYRWKGKVETTREWLCLIKSENSLYEELERTIKKIHPYEIPEVIAVPIVVRSREYAEWLDRELQA